MNKKNLNKILNSKKTNFFMEAHNGITAKLVDNYEFDGIWASGLTISASMGLRDVNEMSWSQVCDILNYMTLSTELPVILDADTGYGSFNNTLHLVKHLDRIGIEGICIEDKIFPKKNSFFQGNKQPLEEIEIFSAKIKSIKDSASNIKVIARIESLIAGWGMQEAIKRADAYRKAGADAILIHSKKKDISEIDQFLKIWDNDFPIVLVPTTYYKTNTSYFIKNNINIVIWANHLLRSSVSAIKNTLKIIKKEKSLVKTENKIIPVKDLFDITGMDELSKNEKKYLPKRKSTNAIILAASQGKEFGNLTKKLPKSLLLLKNKPILGYQIDILNKLGIKDISVVSGFKKGMFNIPNIKLYENKNWEKTSNLFSLWSAKDKLSETIISYGDIIYNENVLEVLNSGRNEKSDITILCDKSWINDSKYRNYYIGVKCKKIKSNHFFNTDTYKLNKLEINLTKKHSDGEFIGIIKLTQKGSKIFKKYLTKLGSNKIKKITVEDFINYLISKKINVYVKYIDGGWIDIDNEKLLINARKIIND